MSPPGSGMRFEPSGREEGAPLCCHKGAAFTQALAPIPWRLSGATRSPGVLGMGRDRFGWAEAAA